jgi:hypothetical protein
VYPNPFRGWDEAARMPRQSLVEPALVTALLACTLVLGVALRLEDPLSTRALGAEDPYTHVVFVKEWIAQGYFADSFHLGTGMYPPGMHAFVAVFAPLAGVDLYDFARIAPAFFGALAILGMFALAQRLAGNAAGLAAALVTAIMPEHVFRTELLFPTALDLAVLPVWLLGFHLALTTHRKEGAVLFLGASVPLAIMHPWLVPLVAAPLALFVALRALRGRLGVPDVRLGAALLVPPVAFAMAFRWDESDTGFADFFSHLGPLSALSTLDLPRPVLFLALLAVLGALAALGAGALQLAMRVRIDRMVRLGLGFATAAALLVAAFALSREPPQDVDYARMLGMLALALGLAGLALAFIRPTPLGDLAAALAIPLFPLTAIDIFDSPFWPQRTVAYLCFAVALLAGNAAAHAHELPMRFRRSDRTPTWMPVASLVVVTLLVAGGAAATHEPVYKWYRLYNEEHFAGFEEVSAIVEQDPAARVVIHTWQPALMVKTLTDPNHVWYSPNFFSSAGERAKVLDGIEGPAYVLVDKYTLKAEEAGKAKLGFLDDRSTYRPVYASDDGRLTLYEVVG